MTEHRKAYFRAWRAANRDRLQIKRKTVWFSRKKENRSKHPSRKYKPLTGKAKERHLAYGKMWRDQRRAFIGPRLPRINQASLERKYARIKAKKLAVPQFRLESGIRCAISVAMKRKGASQKITGWRKALGYSFHELKTHLESKFLSGMTWENYGLRGWHIDHRTPVSWFQYSSINDSEFKRCWSLENLTPKWAYDNLAKGNRWAD